MIMLGIDLVGLFAKDNEDSDLGFFVWNEYCYGFLGPGTNFLNLLSSLFSAFIWLDFYQISLLCPFHKG
jgi:hypothetical protein